MENTEKSKIRIFLLSRFYLSGKPPERLRFEFFAETWVVDPRFLEIFWVDIFWWDSASDKSLFNIHITTKRNYEGSSLITRRSLIISFRGNTKIEEWLQRNWLHQDDANPKISKKLRVYYPRFDKKFKSDSVGVPF